MLLRNLILLLALVGTTQYYAQKELDNICLTPKEFDFYANKYVRYKSLLTDTTIMGKEIRTYIRLQAEKSKIISVDSLIIINKDGIINAYKESYSKLSDKYTKEKTHCKRRTNILIGSLSVNVLLVGIIWLVK